MNRDEEKLDWRPHNPGSPTEQTAEEAEEVMRRWDEDEKARWEEAREEFRAWEERDVPPYNPERSRMEEGEEEGEEEEDEGEGFGMDLPDYVPPRREKEEDGIEIIEEGEEDVQVVQWGAQGWIAARVYALDCEICATEQFGKEGVVCTRCWKRICHECFIRLRSFKCPYCRNGFGKE